MIFYLSTIAGLIIGLTISAILDTWTDNKPLFK